MATLRTVTLNTGFDDYFTVGEIAWGGVAPMHAFHSVCSGKGISCARTAGALGLPAVAYALVGEADVEVFGARLSDEGITHRLVGVPGSTRHNLTLVDGTGQRVAAHFVAQGFHLTADDVTPLVDAVLADIEPGDVVTLNGSTATGLPDDTWAGLAEAAIERGARVIVDAQKAAFIAALRVPGVFAFKPNDDEILPLPGVADSAAPVSTALRLLRDAGARLPLVSLGADGVAFLDGDVERRATCPVDNAVVSVMAGDAFVAGMAQGLLAGAEPVDCLRHGLAAAAAHVEGLSGSALRSRAVENLARLQL
ncbi:MAG: PfkB family carbohydrate kinase [Propionibacteriaceae bacterium]|nr:PfkB family carbohydrate kinase [Propionibacteriaceae bacterium]